MSSNEKNKSQQPNQKVDENKQAQL